MLKEAATDTHQGLTYGLVGPDRPTQSLSHRKQAYAEPDSINGFERVYFSGRGVTTPRLLSAADVSAAQPHFLSTTRPFHDLSFHAYPSWQHEPREPHRDGATDAQPSTQRDTHATHDRVLHSARHRRATHF